MTYQIPFTYIPCQTCTAKIHCQQCADTVAQSILKLDGISRAEIDMNNKLAHVDGTMDRDELEGIMEDIGVFPD